MVIQHHQLNGHEFEQTLGDSGGQCTGVSHQCATVLGGPKMSNTTQGLNNNEHMNTQMDGWVNNWVKGYKPANKREDGEMAAQEKNLPM